MSDDVNSPPSPGKPEPAKLLLNRREAGHVLSVSAGTIDNLVKRGELHPVFIGRLPRFSLTELQRFCGHLEGKSAESREESVISV
jgi:excisionase family DNA binding protein